MLCFLLRTSFLCIRERKVLVDVFGCQVDFTL